MPTGYGFYWYGHAKTIDAVAAALRHLPAPGTGFVGAIRRAVTTLEVGSGVPAATIRALSSISAATGTTGTRDAPGTAPNNDVGASDATVGNNAAAVPAVLLKTRGSNGIVGSALVALAILVVAVVLVVYRWGITIPSIGQLKGQRYVLLTVPLALLLAVAGVISLTHASPRTPSAARTFASNPNIFGNTLSPPRAAPAFRLADEVGKPISLKQYRGKVVLLAFIDAECQTVCPLTNEAMLDAKRELGPNAKDVQLLAIDANWKSTQVYDVQNYTQLHGMRGQWHFLTGSLPQLKSVWSAYDVDEKAFDKQSDNDIDHVPDLYVIDPDGRERAIFTTEQSYASIPQFGQLLADEASALLPSHPLVLTHYSLRQVPVVSPEQRATVPRVGGGDVHLGPGRPHLYLFFDSWDTQTTGIAAHMDKLNQYAHRSRTEGLPSLTAIDEGSVEPNASALPRFLHSLPHALDYPVGVDATGQVADGYEVEGEPWFVETNARGKVVWYQEIYTAGWPTLAALARNVRAGLKPGAANADSNKQITQELAGSPAPLAALHRQASKLLPGGQDALDHRLSQLTGYPIVINIWGSWCTTCQQEFPLFANASAAYGRQVAFLGADFHDATGDAVAFLRTHRVSYPSYETTIDSIQNLLPGGIDGTPTTLYFNSNGKLVHVHTGEYDSQGTLDRDIETYALGPNG